MSCSERIPASVLATVLVVSALMLLSVLGVLTLWDADFVFFARAGYLSRQRTYLESAFVLYAADSTLAERNGTDGNIQLFDNLPDSRVRITAWPWGLYEAVRVESADPRTVAVRLFGTENPFPQECNFWYATEAPSLTLAGRTVLHGQLRLPRHGVQYGQIRSVFFNGERIEGQRASYAGKELPALRPGVRQATDNLLHLLESPTTRETAPDSQEAGFGTVFPRLLNAADLAQGTHLAGMIVLVGDEVVIDSTCRLQNILVVGRTVHIGDGFRGTAQLFATDTVLIGRQVTLGYPSGVFIARENPGRYAEIGPKSRVEGYVIVDGDGRPEVRRTNYRQERTAVVRGLLWADGAAQVQGIVSGCLVANQLAYYTPEGYYDDMLYDMTLLENPAAAYPLWGTTRYRRKEAAWVP